MLDYCFECKMCDNSDDCFLSLDELSEESGCNDNDCLYYGWCDKCRNRGDCPYSDDRCYTLR